MTFKRYTGTGSGQGVAYPRVSIRQSGSIGLNQLAVETLFEDAEYIVPHYDDDDDNNLVGLEPSEEEVENSYKIRHDESGGASITPSAWLNKKDLIATDEDGEPVTARYRAEVVEDEETEVTDDNTGEVVDTYTTDMLVIDLDDPEETVNYDREN